MLARTSFPFWTLLRVSLLGVGFAGVNTQSSWNFNVQAPPQNNPPALNAITNEALATWGQQASQSQQQAANENPVDTLLALAAMPKEVQLSFLEGFGETLKAQTGQSCNIYGGEESCMTLPSDSEFAKLCPNHDLKVDCAFYAEDMQEVQFNPVSDIKRAIEAAQDKDVEDKCPECFQNQLDWFCAAVVPKCGSVRASLESAILPAVSKIMEAQNTGKSWGQALSAAMPDLVRANSLGLPCKEMCHDVMATCACGQDKTFGQLLESYSDSLTGEPLPAAFSMQLFDDLKNTSFCSLYSSSSEPGFNGACQSLSKQCSDPEGWCDASNPAPAVASQIMASQLADSMFGFMNYWSEKNLGLVGKTAQSPDVMDVGKQYIRSQGNRAADPGQKGLNWAFALVGFVAGCVALGGLVAGYWYYSRKHSRAGQGSVQYIAMADSESLINHQASEP